MHQIVAIKIATATTENNFDVQYTNTANNLKYSW